MSDSFWAKNNDLESRNLLDLGRELGVTLKGSEEEAIQRLIQMEERDMENMIGNLAEAREGHDQVS